MSSIALQDSPARPGSASQRERLFEPAGEPTLDDAVSKAWESLSLRGSARCLVCGETLVRTSAEAAGENDAECAGCGSRLC